MFCTKGRYYKLFSFVSLCKSNLRFAVHLYMLKTFFYSLNIWYFNYYLVLSFLQTKYLTKKFLNLACFTRF